MDVMRGKRKVYMYSIYQKPPCGRLLEVGGRVRSSKGFSKGSMVFGFWDFCMGQGESVGTLGLPGMSQPCPAQEATSSAGPRASTRGGPVRRVWTDAAPWVKK